MQGRYSAIASAERGQTVTLCCAVNAAGQSIAPILIFPRVYFKEHFICDEPAGCTGTAHPSGWMTGDGFLLFMRHFVNQVSTVLVTINHFKLRMFLAYAYFIVAGMRKYLYFTVDVLTLFRNAAVYLMC